MHVEVQKAQRLLCNFLFFCGVKIPKWNKQMSILRCSRHQAHPLLMYGGGCHEQTVSFADIGVSRHGITAQTGFLRQPKRSCSPNPHRPFCSFHAQKIHLLASWLKVSPWFTQNFLQSAPSTSIFTRWVTPGLEATKAIGHLRGSDPSTAPGRTRSVKKFRHAAALCLREASRAYALQKSIC